jgi:CubicO group peptidase (beta-lactamase class C family)
MKLITCFLVMANILFSQSNETMRVKVDSLFSEYNKPAGSGAALMIINKGEILYKKGYGFANLEDKIYITPQTNFRLASVTKEFTAASIMLLIERGKLDYTDNLQSIFPDFPDYGKNITIKNLLTHTSGLIDYEDLIQDTVTVQVSDQDVMNMMKSLDSTYFVPGSKYQYSNTGYAILSLVVEKKSGKSFSQFLEENIFEPLGMNNTVAHQEGISIVKNRAYGYERQDSGWVRKDQSITSAVLGDGGIYSSIEDLYKWDQSLYTNEILSDESRHVAMTRAALSNGDKIDYGYGWHLKTYNGDEIVFHTGSTQGFRNVIYRIPSKMFTVIILTNRNEGEMENLAEKIVDVYLYPQE